MAEISIIEEIRKTIENLQWGSVEVIVQDGQVTQISTKIIKKTNVKSSEKVTGHIQKSSKSGINLNFKY